MRSVTGSAIDESSSCRMLSVMNRYSTAKLARVNSRRRPSSSNARKGSVSRTPRVADEMLFSLVS